MLSWFQKLLPREDKFFDMFEAHAAELVAGAQALRRLLDGGPERARYGAEVMACEDRADRIAANVMEGVRRTFITPFDRSDIQELIQSMDDALDQMRQTVKAITLFEVAEFDPAMRAIADLAVQAAAGTARAMPLLRETAKNAAAINAYVVATKDLEERSDGLQEEALSELFKRNRSGNAMDYIVGAEIYEHLEKVLDRFEAVADEVNAIVIEHL